MSFIMKGDFGATEYPSMLKAMKGEHIFSIEPEAIEDGDGFFIKEECDGYYGLCLSKEEVIALAQELLALASKK